MSYDAWCHPLIAGLAESGYAVLENAFPPVLLEGLRDEALARRVQFRPAGIGNQAVRAQAVRGDSID
jgi:hypothetical protein